MRFIVFLADAADGDETVTADVIETGSDVARTNKRILREYFTKRGVPANRTKWAMKKMGFWGEALGR
jgi:hypothetical protein